MERTLLRWLQSAHPPEKMAFISGPRQVGKTTLARQALANWKEGGLYFNWDVAADRRRIVRDEDLLAAVRRKNRRPMIVFDELHKMPRFKRWLKGWYDAYRDECVTWVTGSGRLDLYQRGGDSLLGRYFPYRLHPLSIGELTAPASQPREPEHALAALDSSMPAGDEAAWIALFQFGGFPEPFLKQTRSFHRRWLNTRRERVTHEDIRDLTRIQELARLEFLLDLLAPKVGSPLSLNSLREDLEVAFGTVRTWVQALERTFYLFTVPPYSRHLSRALSKSRKAYFWDWSEVPEPAARFENMVAGHLLKACHMWTDLGCGRYDLWYLRDKHKREVDFLITEARKPWMLIECKVGDRTPSPSLVVFGQALKCNRVLQLMETPRVHEVHKIRDQTVHVVSASHFLSALV